MLTDFSKNYQSELNSRLPKQLQNFEYLLLPVNVKTTFNKELQRYKPEKKPLLFSYKEIPEENFTRIYVENLKKQLSKPWAKQELLAFNRHELNIAINLEFSNLLVIDIDNASITLKQLKTILEYSSGSKRELLEKFYSLITNTFTVKSGNNGFHHYFKFDPERTPTIKKSIKSFALNKLLTLEEKLLINASLDKQYWIENKMDIDILAKTGYCITPPSKFHFQDPQTKQEKQNQYSVYNDIQISELDTDIILNLFDFAENDEKEESKRYLNFNNQNTQFESKYNEYIRRFNETPIEYYLNDMILLEDRTIRRIRIKFNQNTLPKDFLKRLIKDRIKILIKREYFDQFGYFFMLDCILNDYKAMNNYARNKKNNISYHFLSNNFKPLIQKDYDKKDRSGFEFAFLVSQLSMGVNPHILWEFTKRYISDNAKIKSNKYFWQAVDKINSAKSEIDSDSLFIPIVKFLEKSRKINYKYYFGKSSHSCASVYTALIERKMKIANNPNTLWTITHESYSNISLMCRIDTKTVKNCLELLNEQGFITLKKHKLPKKNIFINQKKLEIFSITINSGKSFQMQEIEYYISDALPELINVNSIGRIGSQVYSRLLLDNGKTLKEIYNYFPDVKNPYGTIKPKIEKLLSLGFLEYFEEDKTYFSSVTKLYTKLERAKRIEYIERKKREKTKRRVDKANKNAIGELKMISKNQKDQIKSDIRLKTKKIWSPKPMNVNRSKAENLSSRRNRYFKL